MARLELSPILVEWHDAHAENSWCELSDLDDEPYLVRTVGFLIPDAKSNHVVIAQSVGADDGLDSVLSIPVGMVVRVVVLGNPPQANKGRLGS